jgi:hypothetical protein
MAVNASDALRKLTGGQTLTPEERAVLGLANPQPTPTPAPTPTPSTTTIEGIIAASKNMPYDSTKPATTVTMPFDGTTTPSVKNLDTVTTPNTTAPSTTKPVVETKPITPYADLTAAERAAMSSTEKTDYIKAAREAQAAAEAAARAASNPMFNFAERPDAPPPSAIPGSNYIYYYTWIGGVNNGEWKLYRAPNTEENLAAYGSRAIGGATQATAGSSEGINALAVQPQPIKDKDGAIIGWTSPDGTKTVGATTSATTTTVTTNPSTTVVTTNPSTTVTTTKPTVSTTATIPSGLDAATTALIKSLQDQVSALTKQVSSTTNAATTTTQYNERMGVYSAMAERFNKYGLTSLANKIKELAVAGATEATITLQLMETPEYQQRFAANAERIKKGLSTLTPAEYVNVEDSYRQVLRAYGLNQFDNDAYVRQFIANDMSPTELSNRVVTAVQRVQNADPALVNQLKQYYGIGATDMVAYVLDPQQQFQKIERQIAASEIGVAAGRQGLQAGVSVAEQLAAQGVTEAEARKGYATIADILPTAEKLSDIYGTTLDEYRQAEGEQEVFNSLASAQRKRQKLTAREVAAFSGASGTNKTSLTTSAVGQF